MKSILATILTLTTLEVSAAGKIPFDAKVGADTASSAAVQKAERLTKKTCEATNTIKFDDRGRLRSEASGHWYEIQVKCARRNLSYRVQVESFLVRRSYVGYRALRLFEVTRR